MPHDPYAFILTSDQFKAAKADAAAIANAPISSVKPSDSQFVYFAAFDGTDNGANPLIDGSGDHQVTAVRQLFLDANIDPNSVSNLGGNYWEGPGTIGTISGSDWNPADVTAEAKRTATKAYNDFASQAATWLDSHPGGSITSMITSFSRGGAAAAIFAQMLYENGLVFNGQVLIPPGTVGAVSSALIIDPVLTGETVNTDFPPGVKNLTVVRANNEYRSLFKAADYGNNPEVRYLQAVGNHGDIGAAYGALTQRDDNNLGGIYLDAYTKFFQKSGLSIEGVPEDRRYISSAPTVAHSEALLDTDPALAAQLYDMTYVQAYNLTATRETNTYGTSPAIVTGSATKFTDYKGSIVLGGTGGSYGDINDSSIVVLSSTQVSVEGASDLLTVSSGASLTYHSTTGSGETASTVTLSDGATLEVNGSNTVIIGSNANITLDAGTNVAIIGEHNHITVGAGASFSDALGQASTDTITLQNANGSSVKLDPGTYQFSSTVTNGNASIPLIYGDPIELGTLNIATTVDPEDPEESIVTASFTVLNGMIVDLPEITGNVEVNGPLTILGANGQPINLGGEDSPLGTLEGYLSDLGYEDDLVQANFDYLNPTGTEHEVEGTVNADPDGEGATVIYVAGGPSAIIEGNDTEVIGVGGQFVEVPAYNILRTLNSNLSTDTIDTIDELDTQGGSVTLRNGQLTEFSWITGGGTIILSDGGTIDLTASNINQSSAYNAAATGWDGTTLIGNDRNNETLTASLFGDDTLEAGGGSNVTLIAGLGVDTLLGGEGGGTGINVFYAPYGIADGSLYEGNADNDWLEVGGAGQQTTVYDLTKADIEGMDTLIADNVKIKHDMFEQFTVIAGWNGNDVTINAADGGSYDLSAVDTANIYTMTALSNEGTTLIGNDIAGGTLTASEFGNDTLRSGNGDNDTLIAGRGVNTLIGGTGDDVQFIATNGLRSGSYLESNNSTSAIETNGDISGVTLVGEFESLNINGGDTITLTASQMASVGSNIFGEDGDILYAASGGTFSHDGEGGSLDMVALSNSGTVLEENDAADVELVASISGNDTLSLTNSTGSFLDASGTSGTITLTSSLGSDNIIDASGSTGTVTINANTETSDTIYAGDGSATIHVGGSSTLYAGAGTETIYLDGSLNMLYAGTGTETIYVSGNGNQVNNLLAGDTLIYSGSGDVFDVNYADGITATIGGTFSTVNLGKDITATVSGSHNTVVMGLRSTATVSGSNNTLSFSGNAATISGSSNTILASGNNTFTVTGSNNTLTDNNGADTFIVGGTSTTGVTINGKAYDTYEFVSDFGQDTVNNATGGSTPLGQIVFGSGIAAQNLWFAQSGDDLLIERMGTTQRVTVTDWFSNSGAQVQNIVLNDGYELTAGDVASLVSAMAAYASANPSFDPTAVSSLPSDTTLQAAVTTAWNTSVSPNVDITQTAAVIQLELDHIQSLADLGELGSITLTDSGTPTIAVTATQLVSDAGALAAIVSAYDLSVDGVTVANVGAAAAVTNVATVNVTDTAANVAANLDDLQALAVAGTLGTITLTDTTLLTITETQFTNDADALAMLATGTLLEVTDVAAADAATVAADTNVVLIAVSDTAANVTANIAALETLAAAGEIESIAFTDSGTPALSFGAADAASNIDALVGFTGTFTLDVTDTAANVQANLDALGELASFEELTSITLTDSGTPTLTITAAQAASDAAALGLITGSYDVAVSDTGANVATDLDALQALADAGVLSSVTLTDSTTPTLSVANSQLTDDADALAAITGSYNLAVSGILAADAATVAAIAHVTSITIEDTAANVTANIDDLETLADGGTLTLIALTDTSTPTLSLTAAQLAGDADALDVIFGLYSLAVSGVLAANAASVASVPNVASISISDTAANVTTNLATLQALAAAGMLASIALTDSGTPSLSLTQAQLSLDADALAAITTTYTVSAAGVTAANAADAAAQTGVTSVAVSDTASNVAANLDALQTLAGSGKLASIALINTGTPTLTITAAQLSSDATALGLIAGSYHLAVTAVAAANATTVAANTHVTSITLSDTAANVVTNLDALQGIVGLLTSFALTNSGTPTVAITGAQFVSDIAVVNKITSAYSLTVTGALASSASALNSNTHVGTGAVTVTDSAANVSANINSLQSATAKIASAGITLTDSGTPVLTLTYAQLSDTVLGKISNGTYNITATGVLAANAATASGTAHVTSVLVVDTAAHVQTSIATLQTVATAGELTSVTLTDSGTPTLTFTYTQFTADAGAISAIVGSFNLAVTGVSAANASTVAANSHVTSISISDTSANVASNINTLQTIAGKLAVIAVTDGTNTISITAAQATNDFSALGKLTGTYKIGVTDTAANVSANIDGLQAIYGFATTKLTITVSDAGTNNLNISAVQATNDLSAIGRISGTFHITVTDTAANVSANFTTLQGLVSPTVKLNTVVLTDAGTPTLTILDSQYSSTSGTTVLNDISGGVYNLALLNVTYANASTRIALSKVVSITIADTAANLSTNLNSIQSLATSPSKLVGISVTNSATPVTFTYTQLSSDVTALGLFTGTYSFNVTAVSIANASTVLTQPHVTAVNISDTAANVQTGIDSLQTLAAASQLTGIVLTSGTTITLSASKAANDAAAIQKITSSYTLTVSDTAANIGANLDGLQTLETAIGATKFSSVTITDSATNKVGITAAQATADQVVINKFSGTGNVIVTDSAAGVVSNLTALQAINAKISSIVLTDGGTPNLAITGAQYTADITAINKISSAYTLTVSSVTGANATTVGNNTHVTAFTVVDTAANLGTNMDNLQAQSGKITSITVSNNTVAVPITYTQFTSTDTTAVSRFTGTYSFTVSAVSVANAATVAAQSHVATVSVADTAANVSAGLDGLQAMGSDLLALSLTDGATNSVSINAGQAASDAGAIGKSTGTFHITVTDSSANVWANIAALNSLSTKLTTVVLTDGGTPNFSLTGAQYTADITTLNKISSAYTLTVSAVTAANAGTVGANTHVSSYAVVDTAANVAVAANLTNMQNHLSNLASITFSDSGTPTFAITGAQLNADAGAIAKIASTYKEKVTADANTTETLAGTGSVNTISFATEAQGVTANLATGTATTTHSGTTNTYTLSNFTNLIGSTHVDTLTAGSSGGVLTGNGGADTYVLNASGIDVARDTYTNLNGNTIQNFSDLDGIDISNLTFSGSTLGFSEDASNTFGTLTVTSGTHSAAITLLGQYTTSDFQKVSDGGTGTLVALASTTHLTDILAAAQS